MKTETYNPENLKPLSQGFIKQPANKKAFPYPFPRYYIDSRGRKLFYTVEDRLKAYDMIKKIKAKR